MEDKFKFFHHLKVRYSEIDAQKIVFNAHYLTYLDIAATEYFEEALKLDLLPMAENDEFDFVLAKTTMEYKQPARLWDWLQIWCRVKSIGNSSFTMEFLITKEGENSPVLTAEIIYVSYSTKRDKAVPVPEFIRNRMNEFEKKK